jgi:hypothetical protein
MRKQTMMYSIVDEDEAKKRHGGTASSKLAAIAPTEMMPAVDPKSIQIINAPEPTTVKSIVTELIEREIDCWHALPQDVRDLMLSDPSQFTIIPNKIQGGMPHISFRGVEMSWSGADNWVLVSIRK